MPPGSSPFADPNFANNPEAQKNLTIQQAITSAHSGATSVERRNAIQWMMTRAPVDQYSGLINIQNSDPDPQVRSTAGMAVNVMRSRFPAVIH
jgi:hypothetical protein